MVVVQGFDVIDVMVIDDDGVMYSVMDVLSLYVNYIVKYYWLIVDDVSVIVGSIVMVILFENVVFINGMQYIDV